MDCELLKDMEMGFETLSGFIDRQGLSLDQTLIFFDISRRQVYV